MADTQLQVILREQGVEGNQAAALLEAFGAPFEEAGAILANHRSIVVTDEDDIVTMKLAREKRLALKKTRTEVENKRKELKADIVKSGRAIDSVARFVKEIIEPAEQYLQTQEDYRAIKEAERLAQLKAARIERLSKYVDNPSFYNYMDMTDEQFDHLIAEVAAAKEAKAAADKKAEDDRIAQQKADAAAAEKQRKENERLKAEAAARDKKDAEARAEQARKDAAAAAERDRIQKEADEKVAAERAQREKLEQEKRDREAAEAESRAKAAEAERQALQAPDKEKLLNFARGLDTVRTDKLPAVKSEAAQNIRNTINNELTQLIQKIERAAEAL